MSVEVPDIRLIFQVAHMEEALSKKEDHIKQAQDEHEATIKKVINFLAFCFKRAWLTTPERG